MPFRPYKPVVIPLGRGLDQQKADNIAQSEPVLKIGENIDFEKRGGLVGRPGAVRKSSASIRRLSSTGAFSMFDTTFAARGYTSPSLIPVRDGAGERPGIVTRGRLFSWESSRWMDRQGINPASDRRVCEFKELGVPDRNTAASLLENVGCTYDFGPSTNQMTGAATAAALLAPNGSIEGRTTLTNAWGSGNGARCGTTTAYVHVPPGTNNLVLVTRANGARTLTETVLATDAATPTGDYGDAPCIACDFDDTVFYVAYFTTVPEVKVLRVTTGGVVSATFTEAAGGTRRGIWVTNTTVATNRVVLAWTTSGIAGVRTRVINATTMVNTGVNLTINAGPSMLNSGQVVCGVAENDEVWVCHLDDNGYAFYDKRSLSAATLVFSRNWRFQPQVAASATTVGGGSLFFQHQPIKVNGRVLIGVSAARVLGISAAGVGCTWMVQDITDLWTGTTSQVGGLRDPICVARGASYASMAPWSPRAAILSSNGTTYRFPVVDWQDLRTVLSLTGTGTSLHDGSLFGSRGSLGMREILPLAPQATSYKDSTVIAGSVPRLVARGSAVPCGFPYLEAPCVQIEKLAGGTTPVGSYTVRAIWTWIDEAGQKHYSSPSFPVSIELTPGLQQLSLWVSNAHFNERETGVVYLEVYITQVNPASGDPAWFNARLSYTGGAAATQNFIFSAGIQTNTFNLYTDGQVLECQIPNASGGVAVAGQRAWVSDGQHLFGSRLGRQGDLEAPSWHVDGTLTVEVPPAAGSVIGLSSLGGDRVVAFCERGIFVTGGDGPDDTGQGPGFIPLTRVSDLGLAAQRCVASSGQTLFFQSANTSGDGRTTTGGLYAMSGNFQPQIISNPVVDEINGTVNEVCYNPEREQVYWQSSSQILVFDVRAGQWGKWKPASGMGDTLGTTGVVCGGKLWTVGTEPMAFEDLNGQDTGSATDDITMTVKLANIHVGQAGLQWGRVRAVSLVGDGTVQCNLSQEIQFDTNGDVIAPSTVILNDTGPTTWPSGRIAPEWRLQSQKCSTLSYQFEVTPASPFNVFTAVVFDMYLTGGRAPALKRT